MLKSLFVAVVATISLSAQANNTQKYFQLSQPKIKDVTAQYPAVDLQNVVQPCYSVQANPADVIGSLTGIGLKIDAIVNFGQKIWNLVLQGRPVANVQLPTANALPQGTQCWNQLGGWQTPVSRVYNVTYENLLGMEVVNYNYRVVFTPGGNVDGKGKFITNATIMNADLFVLWGFVFEAKGAVPTVLNQGTKENPVAAMQMDMKWKIDSGITYNEGSQIYFVNGFGQMQEMQ